MKKEKIFSKFNTKNFNNELEEVLLLKPFSENVKNNILNMIYKIEEAYDDYETVKIEVQNEKEFLKKIITSIKKYCNLIQISNSTELQQRKVIIDHEKGTIKTLPNNIWMLYAILEILKENRSFENDIEGIYKKAIYDLLNIGDSINNLEVIRDFNGWSWALSFDEIENITANLIYQNLQILLGHNILEKFMQEVIRDKNEFIKILKNCMKEKYNSEIVQDIINLLRRIAIIEISNINQNLKENILIIKNKKLEEYNFLQNKKEYLKEISNIKKEKFEIIKNIDKIINDTELLKTEYKKRNSLLKNNEKIFSVSCLVDILNNERKEALDKISEINELMDPKTYVEKKSEIKRIIDELSVNEKEQTSSKKEIIELQKLFIECFLIQIKNATEKTDIINALYKVRYYLNIPAQRNQNIKDILEIENEINTLKDMILQKVLKSKIVYEFSDNDEINKKIIDSILNTRIINLQNIYIILRKNESELKIEVYDEDELNIVDNITIENIKSKNIKLNKKIKLFV